MKIIQIVWNGCDGYIAVEDAVRHGYDIAVRPGGTAVLFTRKGRFHSFPVIEVDRSAVPMSEDGEPMLDGFFVTEDFRVFRAV